MTKSIKKLSAVIDYPREDLCLEIWDVGAELPKLKTEIKEEIEDIVYSAISDLGLPNNAVKDILVYGSLLTNQYNQSTDLDARVVLDDEVVHATYPDATGDDLYKYVKNLIQGETLNDTDHPFNATLVVEGDETELGKSELGKSEKEPVYNVIEDSWVVNPYIEEDLDPDEEFSKERDDVEEVMERLDNLLREARTDIIDYDLLEEAVNVAKDKENLEKKIDSKLEEIETGLEDIVDEYGAIKEDRKTNYEHNSPGNVRYKFLERYDYIDVLKAIKHVMSDGLEEEEVEQLEEVIASLPISAKDYLLSYEEAEKLGEDIGIDWESVDFDVEQLQKGYEVELEHGDELGEETDVTQDDPEETAKIAWAHLKELPDYYDRLENMEEEGEEDLYTASTFDIISQFAFSDLINFWDLGMNRSQMASILNQVPLRGSYRITDDSVYFNNDSDANTIWEFLQLNM